MSTASKLNVLFVYVQKGLAEDYFMKVKSVSFCVWTVSLGEDKFLSDKGTYFQKVLYRSIVVSFYLSLTPSAVLVAAGFIWRKLRPDGYRAYLETVL